MSLLEPSLLQSTVDAFVVASRMAIGNMSPTKAKPVQKIFGQLFVGLPAEIRCFVYKFIFADSRLVLNYADLQILTPRGKRTLKRVNIEEVLEKISENKAALLRASDFCKKEAIYILASCTTIEIERAYWERKDLLAIVDHDFLRYVHGVQMYPDTFMRADRSLLPNLREVTLAYAPRHGLSFDISWSVQHIVHTMVCGECGDTTGEMQYEDFTVWIKSWDWKRKQFLYLAQENGWKIKLMLYQECSKTRLEHPMFRCEYIYDLSTETMVSKRVLKHGVEVLRDSDFKDRKKLTELGLYDEYDSGMEDW